MAEEKKKLSVAEILAAARKADSKGAEPATPPADAVTPPASEPAAPVEAAPAKPAAAKAAAPKAGGARPSVAEMLAAARAEKQGGGAAAAKPAHAAPAEKPAPAAKKEAPKPAAAKPAAAAAVSSEPKDTGSILAAARSGAKPGPMSKAEAAVKAPAAVAPRAEKPKLVVPPMPVKPDYAKPKPKAAVDDSRRDFMRDMMLGSFLGIGMTSLATTFGLWSLGLARFMFPNVLTEPPSKFKVGFPSNFAPGQVETKFIPQFGVWVVNSEYNGVPQIYALRSVCTHLGCTPNWLEGEQKFKCPCHGSGFYKDGINFEGPAPRPLERYGIRLADDGQIEIDKSKLFQEEIGQWNDPASYVPV
jgi:cytochrome b6-f complex iron-sulfur subunit